MTLLVLLLAALLEAGGDALVRLGMRAGSFQDQALWWMLGAVVLFSYGFTVNAPQWDFGKLLGAYVVCFFVVAQVLAWVVFHQPPTRGIWIGGALIVAGGLVVTYGG